MRQKNRKRAFRALWSLNLLADRVFFFKNMFTMSIQHPVNMPSAVFVVSCFFWAYNHKIPSDDALKQPLLCTNVPIISSSTLTCCHDDACQHFSPCVRGRKVVCQLTELIHNQARDRISQNLELHTRTHTQRQTEQQEAMHTCRHTNTSLCQICQLTKHVILP